MRIEFDLDWFGPYARRSALADFLEVLALRGVLTRRDELADAIRDNGWTRKLDSMFSDDDEPLGEDPALADDERLVDELDEAELRTDDIMGVLAERAEVLGEAYPFELRAQAGLVVAKPDALTTLYAALLALCVCHVSKEKVPRTVAYVFEDSAQTSLEAHGLRTASLGAISRDLKDFAATLIEAADRVGLTVDPARASSRKFANEEGADTITNLWPQDPRPGGIQLVGQVTVERSSGWKKKLYEPPLIKWRNWLGHEIPPIGLLILPHHVDNHVFRYLSQENDRSDIVDRLRLCLRKRDLLAEEEEAIRRTVGADLSPAW